MTNKQGNFSCWKISRNGKNGGAQRFGPAVKQPAQIQKAPINITVSKYFLESDHLYLIQYWVTLQKVPSFSRFVLKRSNKFNKWGGSFKSGGWKFSTAVIGGCLFKT